MDAADNKKKKRKLKNPETFRERSFKAAEANVKPSKIIKSKKLVVKITSPVTKPTSEFLKIIVKIQPFKAVFAILKLISRIILPKYVRRSWVELKQVTWPNLKNSRQLTFAVLVFAFIFGATVAVVDYGLDKVFKKILLN